ncbi:cytidine deaminase-like protein [Chytridium lagenaria]|nr:cytidine deaminase-like protein [Chytridium lagenaria]
MEQQQKYVDDAFFMTKAIEEARKSEPVATAYCVGAILVYPSKPSTSPDAIITTGFSRELPGNTHAEECCLLKLSNPSSAKGATIYTTMEPCSTRLSGKKPCCERLVDAQVARVVVGCKEPTVFVADCQGTNYLKQNGIVVDYLTEFQDACQEVNKHLTAPL